MTATKQYPTESTGPKEAREICKRVHRYLKQAEPIEKKWREANEDLLGYYYHYQWEPELKSQVEGRGQAVVAINQVRNTVNLMLSLVAAQPLDPQAKPTGKNDDALAEAATAALKWEWNRLDMPSLGTKTYFWAIGYSYGVLKMGFWIADQDRRSEAIQAVVVDPRDISIDPYCRDTEKLTDCRYIDERRKVPLETAINWYPEHEQVLRRLVGLKDDSRDESTVRSATLEEGEIPAPGQWKALEEWNIAGDIDEDREEVVLHEVWEAIWGKGFLIEHYDGRKVEIEDPDSFLFDPSVRLIHKGKDGKGVPLRRIHFHVVAGGMLLETGRSPYDHGFFPYVILMPEMDHKGLPVPEIRYLKDLQDEVNHGHTSMINEMLNRQIEVDPDTVALNGGMVEFAEKVKDPGAVFLVRQAGTLRTITRGEMVRDHFSRVQHAESMMREMSGANPSSLGLMDPTATSGVAKEVQRQQGAQLQRPRESKLISFYKRAGEMLFSLIQQSWTYERLVRITDDIGKAKAIPINQGIDPATGDYHRDPETGMPIVLNDIRQAPYDIEIGVTQFSDTQREKLADIALKFAQSESQDPLIRIAFQTLAIKSLPIPNKQEMLDVLNEAAERFKALAGAPVNPSAVPPEMGAATPPEMMAQVPISPYAPPPEEVMRTAMVA